MNREEYYWQHYLNRVNRRLAVLRSQRLERRKARSAYRYLLSEARKQAPSKYEAAMNLLDAIHQEIAPKVAALRVSQYATEEYLAHE